VPTYDALIVGGGPAGSSCAGALRRAGWQVTVVDRARFPRDKVCAGWLTPDVFARLELTPAEYLSAGLTLQPISSFRTALFGGEEHDVRYGEVVSYAIRRVEFDDFLLTRAGVRRIEATPVVSLRRERGVWIVNDEWRAPVLIGAGGHFCPVARHLRGRGRGDPDQPVVAKEVEVRRRWRLDGEAPRLWFCRDLDGYAWCVPKGDYVNVGIGHRDPRTFVTQFADFVRYVETMGILPDAAAQRWHGHAYLASGAGTRTPVDDGVVLVGDAAGLAYPTSGEGIGPAVESGVLAADVLVAAAGRYDREALRPYAAAISRAHPRYAPPPAAVRPVRTVVGSALLSSPMFVRHVVLDRWFLHRRPRQCQVVSAGRLS
jgi:geranylgeranyl reductase family protein